jgi:hypothetical protein
MQSPPLPCHIVSLMPSIFLINLLPKTLSLCFCVSVRDNVSNIHKVAGKFILRSWFRASFSINLYFGGKGHYVTFATLYRRAV